MTLGFTQQIHVWNLVITLRPRNRERQARRPLCSFHVITQQPNLDLVFPCHHPRQNISLKTPEHIVALQHFLPIDPYRRHRIDKGKTQQQPTGRQFVRR